MAVLHPCTNWLVPWVGRSYLDARSATKEISEASVFSLLLFLAASIVQLSEHPVFSAIDRTGGSLFYSALRFFSNAPKRVVS